MLQPKRVKYRRPHIIRYEGKATSGTTVAFGEYGLEALEGAWITRIYERGMISNVDCPR